MVESSIFGFGGGGGGVVDLGLGLAGPPAFFFGFQLGRFRNLSAVLLGWSPWCLSRVCLFEESCVVGAGGVGGPEGLVG